MPSRRSPDRSSRSCATKRQRVLCPLNRRRSTLSGRLRSVDGRTEERLARNEALFREVNEAINGLAERLDSGMEQGFVCECSDTSCAEYISLTLGEYEAVRADPSRFVLAPGHVIPELETVVAHDADHVVVEKTGRARRVAAATHPRQARLEQPSDQSAASSNDSA